MGDILRLIFLGSYHVMPQAKILIILLQYEYLLLTIFVYSGIKYNYT